MDEAAAFQQLALRVMDSLYSYGRSLTRSDTEAEDLLQETLLRGFRSRRTLKWQLNGKVWLFKIMKNAHIDRCRRKLCRPIEEELREEQHAADATAPLNPEEILLHRLAIEHVRAAIRRMPPLWREVVELREIEGLSYQEIAELTGQPIGTVMSRLHRGRNLLRSLLLDRGAALQPGSGRGL